jgi:formate dehydrogenase accessory protein FdhE
MATVGKVKVVAGAALREPGGDELVQLAEKMPELAEAANFYRAAIPLLRRYRQAVPPLPLGRQAVQKKLEAGLPLLVGEELPLDVKATRSLFLDLCKIAESGGKPLSNDRGRRKGVGGAPPFDLFSLWNRAQEGDGRTLRGAAARQIRQTVERQDLDLASVLEMLVNGDGRRLELTAAGLKLDGQLLSTLSRLSLKPAFQLWARELQEMVDFDRWTRGYCPVCGSSPSLSELQEKAGARRLRCGLCAAGWRYPYLKCAFCQNHDYKLLSYFSLEGEEERYRLQACNVCQGYIKIVKTFEPISDDLLPVQDLATLHLDLVAADHGYTRITQRPA